MIDPLRSLRAIIECHPEHAAPVFDLLVWTTEEMKTASDRAILDEMLEIAYAKTDHAREARERYKSDRTQDHEASCQAL